MAPAAPMNKALVPSGPSITNRPPPTTSPTPSRILTIRPCWPSRTYRSPSLSMAMSSISENSLTPFSVLPAPTITRPAVSKGIHCSTQQGSRPSMMKSEPSWTCTDQGCNSPSSSSEARSATATPPRSAQPKSAHQYGKAARSFGSRSTQGASKSPSGEVVPLCALSPAAASRATTTPGSPERPSFVRKACRDDADRRGNRTICSSAAVASSRPGADRCHRRTAESTSSSLSTSRSSLRRRPIIRCSGQAPNTSAREQGEKFASA
mmetsp:Transcript_129644/g.415785  ORF Transcript_129644/g.415785 Transcript_129644/m.415785 type:complete len:265 (+) Transcript_129644:889-1683(+)